MKRNLRIGLDVDGLLSNFSQAVIERAKVMGMEEYFPKTWEDVSYWDMSDQFKEVMKDAWTDADFWLNIPPLTSPAKIKFKPYCYITSRHVPSTVTAVWLSANGFPKAPVITVRKPEDKIRYIKEHGIDLFVDDLYSTVRQLREAGFNALLYKAPYQRGHVDDCKDLPTIECLSEIGEKCESS